MEAVVASCSKKLLGVPSAQSLKPFIFNVSGVKGLERGAIVEAILENYPPLVRRVRRLRTGDSSAQTGPACRCVSREDFERITGSGRWCACGPTEGDADQVTSVDEIEDQGRDGWVCVHDTYPSAEGAGELRRVFGSKVFSVAVVSAGEEDALRGTGGHLGRQTDAVEYMNENPSVMTSEGEMQVFDLRLVCEDATATLKKVLRIFENKFLDY